MDNHIKTLRANAEKKLVKGYLTSYRAQIIESRQHDDLHRHGIPSNKTIILGGQIELCEKLLGIKKDSNGFDLK